MKRRLMERKRWGFLWIDGTGQNGQGMTRDRVAYILRAARTRNETPRQIGNTLRNKAWLLGNLLLYPIIAK